jgi:hypothetical protein
MLKVRRPWEVYGLQFSAVYVLGTIVLSNRDKRFTLRFQVKQKVASAWSRFGASECKW